MDAPNLQPAPRFRFRAVLDVVATVALLAAAGVVIWTHLAGPEPPTIPVPSEPISLDGAPIFGNPAAGVVIIENGRVFAARTDNRIRPVHTGSAQRNSLISRVHR